MEVVLILSLVFLAVTVIGHGIWLVLAWLIRGGRSRQDRARYEPTLIDDRAAAARYLTHLRSQGLLDDETRVRIMQLMADDLRSVLPAQLPPVWSERPVTPPPAKTVSPPAAPSTGVPPIWLRNEPLHAPPEGKSTRAEPVQRHRPLESARPAPPPTQPPPALSPPAKPHRPFSLIVASFMAEKNIRWGELIGMLLIVCCSTALAISVWSSNALPILKFTFFTAVTAILFGVGLIVHHRWRLPTTGHAVLTTASLLVPLNLLAFAAFSRPDQMPDLWTGVAEAVAIVLFAILSLFAGRVLMPQASALFAGGVVGLSASSLVIRYVSPTSEPTLLETSLLPSLLYTVVVSTSLRRLWRKRRIDEHEANQAFRLLGIQSFACAIALGLLIRQFGAPIASLRLLSPVLCLVAAPALVIGLFLWRRLARGAPPHIRITAASIALIASGVALLAVGLAWPTPSRLLPTLVLNAAAAMAIARVGRHPALHAITVVWLALAWVLGMQLLTGAVAWNESEPLRMLKALISARTGQALVVVVTACVLIAEWLYRRRRRVLAIGYGLTALGIASASMGLATIFGFGLLGDAQPVTWVYIAYAVIAFAVAWRTGSPLATWGGAILGQLAVLHALAFQWPLSVFAGPTSLLIGAMAAVIAAVILHRTGGRGRGRRIFAEPLAEFAVMICLLAIGWMAALWTTAPFSELALRLAWLAALWLTVAFLRRWPLVLAVSQAAMGLAASAAVQHYLGQVSWYQEVDHPAFEPWVWQAHLLVWATVVLLWALIRVVAHRRSLATTGSTAPSESSADRWPAIAHRLLNPRVPQFDRCASLVVLLGATLLTLWAVGPAAMNEFGIDYAEPVGALHTHAGGWAGWLSLGLIGVTLLLRLVERLRGIAAVGMLVIVACAVTLLALRFEADHHVVHAWRLLLASAFGAVSIAFWGRAFWYPKVERLTLDRTTSLPDLRDFVRVAIFLLFALPVVSFTFLFTLSGTASTTTARMPDAWLHLMLLGPSIVVVAVTFGYGVHERRPGYAVGAAAIACAMATSVEGFMNFRGGGAFSDEFAIWLVQLNMMLAAGVTIAWWAVGSLWGRVIDEARYPRWPLLIARGALGLLLFLAAGALFVEPDSVGRELIAIGGPWGILSALMLEFALLTTARASSANRQGFRETIWVVFGAVLLACVLAPFDAGNWLSFHALLLALLAAGWLRLYLGDRLVRRLLGSGWQETFAAAAASTNDSHREIGHDLTCTQCGYNLRGLSPSGRCPECNATISDSLDAVVRRLSPQWTAQLAKARAQTAVAVMSLTLLGTIFALRAAVDDPLRPWWSTAVMIGLGGLCMALAAWTPRRMYAYFGGIEACLVATVWWGIQHWVGGYGTRVSDNFNLVNVNVAALAIVGMVWLLIERRVLLRKMGEVSAGRWPAFHHAAAVLACAANTGLAWIALAGSAGGEAMSGSAWVSGAAWVAATGLMLACTMKPSQRFVYQGLYVLGLTAAVWTLSYAEIGPTSLAIAAALVFVGYALFTIIVWKARAGMQRGIADESAPKTWLICANGLLTGASLGLAGYASWTNPSFSARLIVVLCPAMGAAAAVLAAVGSWRPRLRTDSLTLIGVSAVLLIWSWISAEGAAQVLDHAAGLVAAVSAMTVVWSIATQRLDVASTWSKALADSLKIWAVLAGATLAYCCAYDVAALMNHWPLPMGRWLVAALIAGPAVVIVCCILFATNDRLDPLHVKPGLKGTYVYLAEWLAAAIALHVRTAMPWLFSGFITAHWPLLVMALAFMAAAAGELCERRGLAVLARPFSRTGVFLPAIVLVELFLASSRVHYSVVLMTAGAFYAVLAGLRRSISLGLIAALALNGSLWYLLQHTTGLGLAEHPQLWFIPPALAVLAAGHLNRSQLTDLQRRSIHYACLLVIYLSSTADIFLIGVARAPWLPLVLGGLSVAGILLGIAARIRSFLSLGTGFLCLSLLTMVWHAASNLGWTWMWYVSGIVLGVGIITLFALFEKKRAEMTALFGELREWEA